MLGEIVNHAIEPGLEIGANLFFEVIKYGLPITALFVAGWKGLRKLDDFIHKT